MTIRKGEDWGTLRAPPPDIIVVGSDAELRSLVLASRLGGVALPVIGLTGGDMMRTLGGRGDRSRFDGDEPIPHLPIDIVTVTADDERESVFVAHLVARRSWWRGQITAAMNAQYVGVSDVAPRGHPNDGRIDLITVSDEMNVQQRWMARSRLQLGTHVPHPSIAVRQHATVTVDLPRSTPVQLDGERWGHAQRLLLTVQPDALTVCV
ncbi:MAG: hypothetical protein ABIR32_04155 [Ilumatobacteraceae bacterium]